ncbi:sulfatase-like hydrolase/transferase [Mucilaginibacter terrae]|uniref:Arylsulfatase A-like enzyme n=1 Tax=Mucilaginibacter terrae TaxID=1955052 RepID=A0ABU3GR21_9SPHI|nr:sulfatase-like hydrolase/transferase [Mucilaginibacter terrae]MDT3402228.1 arylsulfatase A-like enzyme [Mucilaginibacter terrae]
MKRTGVFIMAMLAVLSVKAQRPNIVFILADDLGYGDVGVYGQKKIQTPNIDILAREGAKLTDFYAGAPVCSPSRGSLLTGLNTGHATIRGNMTITGGKPGGKAGKIVYRANLLPGEATIGTLLQRAGYTTGLMGKWHVDGFDSLATPLQHGFHDFSGWLIAYPETYSSTYWPGHWYRNGNIVDIPQNLNGKKEYYVSELITDDAIKFMNKHKGDNKPFFVMVNHSNPHSPLDAPLNTIYEKQDWPAGPKTYAAMVSYLDNSVGRIKKYLIDNGLDKNTIIIFCSDNGPRSEPTPALTAIAQFFDSGGPLQGYKRDLTEGGIRIPMIVWNKKLVGSGRTITVPGYFADIMPTFAGLANYKSTIKTDGTNLSPFLLNKQKVAKDRFLYWEFFEDGFTQAVRYGKWKAIIKAGKLSLFDLEKDIHEDNDISAQNVAVVAKIKSYLTTARTDSPYWPVK